MHTNFENNAFMRRASPNYSDDGNSESAMTTLPIGDRKSATTNMESCMNPNGAYQTIIKQPVNGTEALLTGRNTFAFWTIVTIIFILTIGNLILTMTILGVLRLGRGMEHLELVPEADSIKFYGVTDLDRVYKKDGIIEGFSDVPITITGDNSNAQISLVKNNGHVHNKMLMSKNGTQFNGVNQFELRDPQTNEAIFTTHKPHYNIPSAMDNLIAKSVSAARLSSPIDEALSINNTRGKILIRGTEGVAINGKEIILSADQNVYLKTHNGSIVLAGNDGIFLDVKNIPIVGDHGIKIENKQFKICVCMPQGKLFRIQVPSSNHIVKGLCSHYDITHDPCA